MCERFNTHAAFDFSGEVPNYEFGSYNYDVMCIQVILVRVKWTLWAIWYHISLSHFLTKTGSFLALVRQNEEERMCVRCVDDALICVLSNSHCHRELYECCLVVQTCASYMMYCMYVCLIITNLLPGFFNY